MTIQSASDVISKEEFTCLYCRQRITPGEKCVMYTSDLKGKATKGIHPGIIIPKTDKKRKNNTKKIKYKMETPQEFFYQNIPVSRWYLIYHEHCYVKKELEFMTKFTMW